MAPLLALGAGASEGLDTMLARMLMEQKQAEAVRASKADEANKSRQVDIASRNTDIAEKYRQSQEGEINSKNDAIRAAADAEKRRQTEEDSYLADPDVPANLKSFIKMRRVVQKGETIPAQLFENGKSDTNQLHTMRLTDPNLAKQLGKKVGEAIDANYDPKTRTVTYRGVDVTNGVDHYEKPPAPDKVFLQSGDGYIPRAEAAKKYANGETIPLATTSSTRTMGEGAKMLQPHIQQISGMADELDKAGLFGPVMSRIRGIAEKAGTIDEFSNLLSEDPQLSQDERAGRFATSLSLLASGAARVHGGARGASSPPLYHAFKAMLSDAATPQMFKGRIGALDSYLSGYAAGPQKQGEASPGAAAGGDGGGMPTVGGTFNGGKVLKVTPIP